jgi:hypothetical protein
MTTDIQIIEQRTNPYAKQILVGGSILMVLILVVFYTLYLPALRVPMAFLVPIILMYGIVLAIRIYQALDTSLPMIPFLSGALFLAGGAAFDGIATLVKSPTLTREANPIARSLLDSSFPVSLVTLYGIISQLALVTFVCILWAAFLKHKDTFIALANSKNETSRSAFFKAAFGGAHLSWRQFLVPYKFSEFPTSYYMLWLVPVGFVGGGLYRWYLGFNWLGFISLPLTLSISVSVGIPFICYLIWLWNNHNSKP